MKISKNKIIEAVLKNRGGLQDATDDQIMVIWNALTPVAQTEYLASIESKITEPKNKEKK